MNVEPLARFTTIHLTSPAVYTSSAGRSGAPVRQAKEIIREAMLLSPGAPLIIMFSGGKDSVSVLLLAQEITRDLSPAFMSSSIDLPGSIEHATRTAHRLGYNLEISSPLDYQGSFFDVVRRFGYFPTVQKPFCSGRLKLRPMRQHLRRLYGRRSLAKLTGVRRYESSRRRRMYATDANIVDDPEHSGSYLVHPILEWTDADVLEYLAQHDIALESPLYRACGVSGCYWCPFYQDQIIQRVERGFPGIYAPIIALERYLQKPSLQGHKYLADVIERMAK